MTTDSVVELEVWGDGREDFAFGADFAVGAQNTILRRAWGDICGSLIFPKIKISNSPILIRAVRVETVLLRFRLLSNLSWMHFWYFFVSICIQLLLLHLHLFPYFHLQFINFHTIYLIHQLVNLVVLLLKIKQTRLQTTRMVRWD